MAKLAIKGHETRGKEVIEILEMLGGKNIYNLTGTKEIWYILSNNTIEHSAYLFEEKGFTLEEFLEKFPYKIGDKVIYEDKRREITKMVWEGQTNTVAYKLDDKLYCNVVNKLQPYKEETMDRKYNVEEYLMVWKETEKGLEVLVNDKFELKEDSGKFYIIKKQLQYPKTYEECCKIVNANPYVRLVYNLSDRQKYSHDEDELQFCENIRRLKICRDAYWKIAGEQMGLDKPWEPDWVNAIYTCTIICRSNKIVKDAGFDADNRILAFPTEEMRDAFYENFKDLIEECKEFL